METTSSPPAIDRAALDSVLFDHGLTVSSLAEHTGYHRTHLSAALNGREPISRRMEFALRGALGDDVDRFLS